MGYDNQVIDCVTTILAPWQLPILNMEFSFPSFSFPLSVYDTATGKIIYEKIAFAQKTDAATQQPKDGVRDQVADVYNSDLTCLAVSVGGVSL